MTSALESKTREPSNPENPFDFHDEGWSPEDCTDEGVQDLVARFFTALCEDARSRVQQAQDDISVLEHGPWYANEYMGLLLKHKQTQRYEFLKTKGHFYHGFPPKTFQAVPKEKDGQTHLTGKAINHYRLKDGTSPCDALDETLPLKNSRFYFIDCHMMVQLAHYCALRVIFGKERFNRHFSTNPFILTADSNPSLWPFYTVRNDSDSPRRGDACLFQNVPAYGAKHMDGEAGGFHVICVSEDTYEGFGLKPRSKAKDIFAILADEFNKDPISLEQILPKNLADTRQFKTYDEFPPSVARQIQQLRFNADSLAAHAQKAPDKIGLHQRKIRLSSRKIQEALRK